MQIVIATLSCVALGSLLLPWFNTWVPFSLIDPRFLLLPVPALETWAGWSVAVFDGLLLASAIACMRTRQRGSSMQWWLAAGAVLVMSVEGLMRLTESSEDLELRMRALGPPEFEWSWLRLELAIPVVANAVVLLLGRPIRTGEAPSANIS